MNSIVPISIVLLALGSSFFECRILLFEEMNSIMTLSILPMALGSASINVEHKKTGS
ncbi:MAG: hypothetical protein ABIQ02_00825 [Saprospiraceae bacterium]